MPTYVIGVLTATTIAKLVVALASSAWLVDQALRCWLLAKLERRGSVWD